MHATTIFGGAWLAAALAFALHVADEATHDFLAYYNPRAALLRRKLGGLPFPPTFTFRVWLTVLLAATLILLALTPAAYAAKSWLRPVAFGLAAIHLANGLLHVAGALQARRLVPGVLSAPLLLATGGWLACAARALP